MRTSVLLPVLDERRLLPQRLAELTTARPHQVIVIDGGSSDGTQEIAADGPCELVRSPPGRGTQINAGARVATGEVLLILHADVRLPVGWEQHICAALEDPSVVAGAFKTWHVPESRTLLSPLFHLADLRSRVTARPYGDQAFFVRRSVFEEVGGCPDQPLFEDLELSRRVARRGTIRLVDARVEVSARRFQAAPLKYLLLMNSLPGLYRARVPLRLLQRVYGQIR